jgi:uncharacterized protein YbcV (DUF1398 family)
MNPDQIAAIRQCATLSVQGKLPFGAAMGRLMAIGVERYHADYSRHERTYYLPDGESLVFPVSHPPGVIARAFVAADIEVALEQIRRGEIIYPEFLKLTQAAGVVGYFAHIAGGQVIYFGRNGEQHIVRISSASRN